MGCDIHMFAEVKTNGKWIRVGEIFEGWSKGSLTDEPYTGRNYDLFAILADVRNGLGFAGIVTGSGFNPIADPKGLPNDSEYLNAVSKYAYDVSPMSGKSIPEEEREKNRDWIMNSDYHSHSYFTLDELMKYDWNQLTLKSGVVTKAEYLRYKKDGSPSAWCGSVSGGGVRNISNEEMETAMDTKHIQHYTTVEWGSTYAERCGNFLNTTIPALQRLGDRKDVRIVFWFDN